MSASYQDDPHLNIFKSLLRGSAHSDSFRPTCKVGRKLRNVFRSVILIERFEQRFATDLETMCAPARC